LSISFPDLFGKMERRTRWFQDMWSIVFPRYGKDIEGLEGLDRERDGIIERHRLVPLRWLRLKGMEDDVSPGNVVYLSSMDHMRVHVLMRWMFLETGDREKAEMARREIVRMCGGMKAGVGGLVKRLEKLREGGEEWKEYVKRRVWLWEETRFVSEERTRELFRIWRENGGGSKGYGACVEKLGWTSPYPDLLALFSRRLPGWRDRMDWMEKEYGAGV
jgi:hypothetical protein